MSAAIQCEPDDGDFPSWESLAADISFASWARPLVDAVLGESAGENFMVTVAGLEFIRQFDHSAPVKADDSDDEDGEKNESDSDDEDRDLGEAGDDWLADQGFDSNKS
jgi:hypothetical protein